MNPTFNLSAADAPLEMLPASRSAAAAARNVFLIVNLQTVGGNDTPGRGAPSRTPRIRNQRPGANTVPSAAVAAGPPARAPPKITANILILSTGYPSGCAET